MPGGFGSRLGVVGRLWDCEGVEEREEASRGGGGSSGSRSAGRVGTVGVGGCSVALGTAGWLGDVGAAGGAWSGARRLTDEMRLRTLDRRLLDSDDGAGGDDVLVADPEDSDEAPEKRLDRRLVVFFLSPSMVRASLSEAARGLRGTEERVRNGSQEAAKGRRD